MNWTISYDVDSSVFHFSFEYFFGSSLCSGAHPGNRVELSFVSSSSISGSTKTFTFVYDHMFDIIVESAKPKGRKWKIESLDPDQWPNFIYLLLRTIDKFQFIRQTEWPSHFRSVIIKAFTGTKTMFQRNHLNDMKSEHWDRCALYRQTI